MKALTAQELEASFRALEGDYDVRVPVALHDGTRALGKLDDGPLALAGGALPLKITSAFFPQMETIFQVGDDGLTMPPPPARPLLVVGFTAQDAACLEFIDRFFSEGFRDDLYLNKRHGAVVVCVSGRCGRDGEPLKIAGGKCDLELICDGQRYLIASYSQAGEALAGRFEPGRDVHDGALAALRAESDHLGDEEARLIETAARLLREEKVPEEFWQGIADRCIACTSCNLACPTCTCFDVFDSKAADKTVRWRLWDSCQLDGFMREASGHNPMGAEHLRTRRRIHHKLAADPMRWQTITCFLCGRCDEVCPTGIGIKAVCREMINTYGSP